MLITGFTGLIRVLKREESPSTPGTSSFSTPTLSTGRQPIRAELNFRKPIRAGHSFRQPIRTALNFRQPMRKDNFYNPANRRIRIIKRKKITKIITPLLWTQRLQPIRASNQFPPANEKRDLYTTQPIRAALNFRQPIRAALKFRQPIRTEIFYKPANWQII